MWLCRDGHGPPRRLPGSDADGWGIGCSLLGVSVGDRVPLRPGLSVMIDGVWPARCPVCRSASAAPASSVRLLALGRNVPAASFGTRGAGSIAWFALQFVTDVVAVAPEDDEVLDSVVLGVAVDVVDDLLATQRIATGKLHNHAVFSYVSHAVEALLERVSGGRLNLDVGSVVPCLRSVAVELRAPSACHALPGRFARFGGLGRRLNPALSERLSQEVVPANAAARLAWTLGRKHGSAHNARSGPLVRHVFAVPDRSAGVPAESFLLSIEPLSANFAIHSVLLVLTQYQRQDSTRRNRCQVVCLSFVSRQPTTSGVYC